jgi:hypothetical protein
VAYGFFVEIVEFWGRQGLFSWFCEQLLLLFVLQIGLLVEFLQLFHLQALPVMTFYATPLFENIEVVSKNPINVHFGLQKDIQKKTILNCRFIV